MTRRFGAETATIYDFLQKQYDEAPEKWFDRDDLISRFGHLIAPGDATRIARDKIRNHGEFSNEELIRKGRRTRLMTCLNSLERQNHLLYDETISPGRVMVRFNPEAVSPGLGKKKRVPQPTAVEPVAPELAELMPFPSRVRALRTITKSDVGKFKITHYELDGAPCIRWDLGDQVIEGSTAAILALCDRLTAQSIYAQGRLIANGISASS